MALLRQHRIEQHAEREIARQLWRDEGWVFATPTGGPGNPNTDYHELKELLEAAGLRHARLHDARHTAATVLLILGQPERTVTVRRDSLASILPLVEDGLTRGSVNGAALAELQMAFADLHEALSGPAGDARGDEK